jgi:hypothetical protein
MVVHRLEQVTLGVHHSIWLDQKIRGQWERVQKEGYRVYRGRVMERQLAESARLAPSRATASKVMEIDIVLSEHLNISRECRQSRNCSMSFQNIEFSQTTPQMTPTRSILFCRSSEHLNIVENADKVDDVPSC